MIYILAVLWKIINIIYKPQRNIKYINGDQIVLV